MGMVLLLVLVVAEVERDGTTGLAVRLRDRPFSTRRVGYKIGKLGVPNLPCLSIRQAETFCVNP